MSNYILSILIPLYNSSTDIQPLLKSLIKMRKKNVEIVFIDDGSTDDSLSNVTGFLNKNGIVNIKALRQDNAGISIVRNRLIDQASGDFIWFIDPDDFVSVQSLNEVLNLIEINIENNEFDLIQLPFKKFSELNDVSEERLSLKNVTGAELVTLLFERKLENYVWAYIVRKEIFSTNDISFPNRRFFAEDMNVTYRVYKHVNKAILINTGVTYWYRQYSSESGDSLTTTIDNQSIVDRLENVEAILSDPSLMMYRKEKYLYVILMYVLVDSLSIIDRKRRREMQHATEHLIRQIRDNVPIGIRLRYSFFYLAKKIGGKYVN